LSWNSQLSGILNDLHSIFFTDSNTGWAVGYSGTIINTTNGGTSWIDQSNGSSAHFESVQFTNSNTGWIAGYNALLNKGVLLKTTNGGLIWEDQLTNIKPWLHSVYLVDSENGWAVGTGGTILKTTNGGVTFAFSLYQNYPNPFNPTTTISWQSPVSSWQTLKVYDVLGSEIATLVNEEKPAGSYEINFDAKGLTSGIYFYTLIAGSFRETKKMILLR